MVSRHDSAQDPQPSAFVPPLELDESVARPQALSAPTKDRSPSEPARRNTVNLAHCPSAVAEPETILLPYLNRPSELKELLLSPSTPPPTRTVMRHVLNLFPPGSLTTSALDDPADPTDPFYSETFPNEPTIDPSARAAATDTKDGGMRNLFLAVLLAPRPVLPDAEWVAAMYLLLYPRDAQLWSKFAAIVGADVDRTEWEAPLRELVTTYAGHPGQAPPASERLSDDQNTMERGHGDPVDEPHSVLLRAGMGLAHSIKDARKDNSSVHQPSFEGSSAHAPATNTTGSSPMHHHPPTTEALSQRRGWTHTLPFSQVPLNSRSPPDSASSPELGVSMSSGAGLSPGMGGCMLLPVNENLSFPAHGSPKSEAPGGGPVAATSPTSSRSRRSKAHSRGSSLPSPRLDDLREEPEPVEAGYAASAPMTSSSDNSDESEPSSDSVRDSSMDQGRTQYAPESQPESDAEEDYEDVSTKGGSSSVVQRPATNLAPAPHRSNRGRSTYGHTIAREAQQPTDSDPGKKLDDAPLDRQSNWANNSLSSPWSSSHESPQPKDRRPS